jgi:hypothetical protein
MEKIMAYLLFFILGIIVVWGIITFGLLKLFCSRHQELKMINDIKEDIKLLKELFKKIK